VTLGNNQVLTPGVYSTGSGAAATLEGNLTLDGQGNPNALFIIKIDGAFETATYTNVFLINGASLLNVFWQITGAFTLGDYSVFNGNIVSGGAIELLEGSTLQGRGLTTAGAITLHNNNVSFSPGAAGTITGTSTVCQGETGLVYTVPVITNATSYNWTLPAGATITAGENTNAITVSFSNSAVSGNITVQGSNSYGTGAVSADFLVTVNPRPNVADQIIDISTGETFTVTPVGAPLGTTYTWTAPTYTGSVTGGIPQLIPQTSISGLLTILSGDGSATYTVTPTSGSCVGNTFTVTVTVTSSCTPVTIGTQPVDDSMCATSGNASFTVIASGSGPFTYQWQYNNGGSWEDVVNNTPIGAIYSNSSTATLGVAGITTTGSPQYRSYLTNCVGANNITSNTVTLTINPYPSAAGIITGTATVCQTATGIIYTVPVIENAINYIWTLPAGASITAGANTNSITVSFDASAVSGDITVQGSNNCGTGTISANFAVTVKVTLVAVADSNSPVCEGSSINLTAQTATGGTYIWTGPNGFTSSAQNPVIPAAKPENAGIYTLIVSTSCQCCFSAPSTVTVIVNNCYVTDLRVINAVNNSHPFIGKTVVFTITASNHGPDNATGVTVSDISPSGLTYVSSTTTVGTYDSETGDWTIGSMNHGESEILTITATVSPTGTYVNTASITGIETDGDLSNNMASVTTYPTDFFIPEGFSPNGDNINDLFVIRGIVNYPDNKLIIYNRWGNKVYAGKSIPEHLGWKINKWTKSRRK